MGLIRLFLALDVAIDHWLVIVLHLQFNVEDVFPAWLKLGINGGYAVMFFYMISGFLITYTLTRHYASDANGTLQFLRNRAIRIFSLYWPMAVVAMLIWPPAFPDFEAADIVDKFTKLFLLGLDWSVAFKNYPIGPFKGAIFGLHQAWTLGVELGFYLIAPFVVRSWKVTLGLLMASLALRMTFVALHGFDEVWVYYFAPSSLVFFMMGAISLHAARRIKILANPWLGILALALSAAEMTFGAAVSFDSPRLWISALFFAASLPGVFSLTKDSRSLNFLGDLSYPVYLVHAIVLNVTWQYIAPWAMARYATAMSITMTSVGIYLVAVAVAAVAAHWLLEIPTAKLMRLVFPVRRRPEIQAIGQPS